MLNNACLTFCFAIASYEVSVLVCKSHLRRAFERSLVFPGAATKSDEHINTGLRSLLEIHISTGHPRLKA